MAKPSTLPTWATDTNFTGGAENATPTKVAPSSGKQAEGWEPGEEPAAQSLNWWQNLVYLWAAYLDSGALEGPHSINNTLSVAGDLSGAGTITLTSLISPAGALVGTTHNYNPTGLSTALMVSINTGAAGALGGIVAQPNGRILILMNSTGTSSNMTLNHEDAGSTAANRIQCANAGNTVIRPFGTAILVYLTSLSRWRVLAVNG